MFLLQYFSKQAWLHFLLPVFCPFVCFFVALWTKKKKHSLQQRFAFAAETRETKTKGIFLYLSARLIVVQVHQTTRSLFNLTSIHKAPRELDAVLDISRASSPLPAFFLIIITLLLPVTSTLTQIALAACCCDSMGHPGCSDGVGKSCFPAA